ncbi:MAG: signal peptidase I [Armatimonadota bacterium]
MPVIEELDTSLEQLSVSEAEDDKPESGINAAIIASTWLQSAVVTIVIFLFLVTFVVQGFAVSGSCMEPNLRTGERILGNKFIYRFKTPARGDVIVFSYPRDPKKAFIKRIVGLPGETIEIHRGQVFIDQRPLAEHYLIRTPHGDFGPEKIRKGNLFVMGDYRDNSRDSRDWGELPINKIRAKAWLRYWPVKRVNVLD